MPEADHDGKLDRARERAVTCDAMVLDAVRDVYRSNFSPPFSVESMIQEDARVRWNIEQLIDDYAEGQAYPIEHLAGVIDRAIDLKLEHHFILTTTEMDNSVLRTRGFNPRKPISHPRAHLDHLCLLQNLIGQTRALWERTMTLIFYLEEGKDPSGKRIRKDFFGQLSVWSPRWDAFQGWQEVILGHDKDYRTPEFHIGSRLRKELFGYGTLDPNDLHALYTPILGGFWGLLTANVRGERSRLVRLAQNVSRGPGLDRPASEIANDES